MLLGLSGQPMAAEVQKAGATHQKKGSVSSWYKARYQTSPYALQKALKSRTRSLYGQLCLSGYLAVVAKFASQYRASS